MTSADVEDRASLRSVWLHVHVPKAGGSTLRHLLNRSFGKGYYNSTSLLETKQYTCAEVSEIIRCHPHISCISDHKFSLDLPYQHPDAQVRALCFVREPVERFVSRYFFHKHFEEVACIAQRMSFRQFAEAELVQKYAHPQTNSQVHFLNGGRGTDAMELIEAVSREGHAYVFPIERFDDAAIALERIFPTYFPDLSYVRANVSVRNEDISSEDREFVRAYFDSDQPLFSFAQRQLDAFTARAFSSLDDRQAAMNEFRERCQRRFHNFHAPRPRHDNQSAGSLADQQPGGGGDGEHHESDLHEAVAPQVVAVRGEVGNSDGREADSNGGQPATKKGEA